MGTIRLRTFEGDFVDVDEDIAKVSKVLAHRLYILKLQGVPQDSQRTVSVSELTMPMLLKLLEWMTHHKSEQYNPCNRRRTKVIEIDSFDIGYLRVDKKTRRLITDAAQSLKLKPLLEQISMMEKMEETEK